MVQRRDLFEELAHLGIALVPVFDAAQVAPVRLGALEEGDEVGDADHVHRAATAGR